MRSFRLLAFLFALLTPASQAQLVPTASLPAAQAPTQLQILGITVEGADREATRNVVLQTSGLRVGQEVTLPLDAAFGDAIRSIYRMNQFSDVKIIEERRVADGVFLIIRVEEAPRLNDYSFVNVRKGWREDIRKQLPLIRGARVTEGDLARAKQVVEEFYREKGFLLAEASAVQTPAANGGTDVLLSVNPGSRVEVEEIIVRGNQQVSDRRIRARMKETRPSAWWQFWARDTFKEDKYEEELQNVIAYYNERGFYDARIVRDTTYLRTTSGKPGLVVELDIHEGPRYHVRDIAWEGNTVYTDEQLSNALGLQEGDVYNNKRLEQNLYFNPRSSDVSSLYYNQGYMRFNVNPTVRVLPGDSLDLVFDVFEGDIYRFGHINIAGNDKTKEHVIRRELYTIPGQTFSRESITESIRRLSQLNYFNQESLQGGPGMDIDDEDKTVDLAFNVEEVGGDQLELSGTWGRIGLILQLGVTFNNFSAQNLFNREAWRPLPMGDGQQLSLRVQTNGLAYQNYSVSFTEPWFRGKPTPIGFALSFARTDLNRLSSSYYYGGTDTTVAAGFRGYVVGSARGFFNRRLRWPDDKFDLSTALGYRYYNVTESSLGLPRGVNHELTLEQSLTRNSQDHPIFPRRGSLAQLSLEVAPPIPGFIQYHKWSFRTAWNAPLSDKITFGVTTNYGYIGSFGDEEVQFQRYLLGGSPFDAQGINYNFGKDLIFMRGYKEPSLGPVRNGNSVGGRILNKYTSELRWLAVTSPQLQASPYLFADAANTWDSFNTYNPAQLYRSAGAGVRLFLPILGMIELAYGYAFDEYVPLRGADTGARGWRFQFTIGQGFNQ